MERAGPAGVATPAMCRHTAASTGPCSITARKWAAIRGQVPGWDTMRVTDASQLVQRSGFPLAYERWATMAGELAAELRNPESPCR